MAKSSRGVDPLRSIPPLQAPPAASQPGPTFPIPSHYSSARVRSSRAHDEPAKNGHYQNRNVIPGLALSFSSDTSDWQRRHTIPTQVHGTVPPYASQPSQLPPLTPSFATPTRRAVPLPQAREERTTPDEGIEDGEVCEDDPKDSYDPFNLNETVDVASKSQARERSGSYSPYLSPREVDGRQDRHDPAGTLGGLSQASPNLRSRNSKRVPGNPKAGGRGAASQQTPKKSPGARKRRSHTSQAPGLPTVSEARKQAQDAILRLWPLNVRYQHYLAEGIDESLVKSLFQDLGFDVGQEANKGGAQKAAAIPAKDQGNSVKQGGNHKKGNSNNEVTPKKARAQQKPAQDKSNQDKSAQDKSAQDKSAQDKSAQDKSAQDKSAPDKSAQDKPAQDKPAQDKPAQEKSAQEKSESRKDRIARLLAAKNTTKSSPAVPQPVKPQQVPISMTLPPKPPSNNQATQPSTDQILASAKSASQLKSQSDKSKLLHQKMEALKKSREARGQKRPHQDVSAPIAALPTVVTAAADDITPVPSNMADSSAGPMEKAPRDAPESKGSEPGTSFVANKQAKHTEHPASSIPGLFLSSTPQPSPTQKPIPERHSAPLVSLDADERPFKRPFGQARESRPFLIDVSDDEDDAEMDIDSPEHHTSSTHRPASPTSKTSSKSAPSIGESGLLRQIISLSHTSSGTTSSDSSTKGNLETMNKQIEAMKLRIAEAEARKKAKRSLPDSPASTPMHSGSQDDIGDKLESLTKSILIPRPLSPAIALSRSPSQAASEMPHAASSQLPETLPKRPDTDCRSLSRAASERLPLLETRRREQQLRLQLLQSQMAGIEREIQESLQEEERLKQDVGVADMDLEVEVEVEVEVPADGAEVSARPPTSEMTSPADARGTTPSISLASIVDVDHGTNAALAPAQEPSGTAVVIDDQAASAGVESEVALLSRQVTSIVQPEAVDDVVERESSQTTIETQSDDAEDVEMEEDEDSEDGSEEYEPPEADVSSSSVLPQPTSPPSHLQAAQHADEPIVSAQADLSTAAETDPPARANQDDTAAATAAIVATVASVAEPSREVDVSVRGFAVNTILMPLQVEASKATDEPQTGFAPYETPLQQFQAFRFHRGYNKAIAGGLRSLTYSNKVDVKKELCPDELAGRSCPRGRQCEFQHFDTMQAPDDQILLQLGACNHHDKKLEQKYNEGLRQLLIEFRNNKVKDFQIISQAIIDYRARFLGDESKVLPLGNVTL